MRIVDRFLDGEKVSPERVAVSYDTVIC